jgi:hypothetical protein
MLCYNKPNINFSKPSILMVVRNFALLYLL